MSMSGITAKKFDGAKPDLSLCPTAALEEMARAFMHGEKKYGRDNYRGGMASHRFIAAAMRHLLAWRDGEDSDPESGYSHLGHALASIAMLLECRRIGTLVDTRPALPTRSVTITSLDPSYILTEEEATRVTATLVNR
jgi:hypothetical protein